MVGLISPNSERNQQRDLPPNPSINSRPSHTYYPQSFMVSPYRPYRDSYGCDDYSTSLLYPHQPVYRQSQMFQYPQGGIWERSQGDMSIRNEEELYQAEPSPKRRGRPRKAVSSREVQHADNGEYLSILAGPSQPPTAIAQGHSSHEGEWPPSVGAWAHPTNSPMNGDQVTQTFHVNSGLEAQAWDGSQEGWSSRALNMESNSVDTVTGQGSSERSQDQTQELSKFIKRGTKRSKCSDERQQTGIKEVEPDMVLTGLERQESAPDSVAASETNGIAQEKLEDVKPSVSKKEKEGLKRSCAECRRLKAKCDRQFPCSNCRRRGCALVCPDGDLSCMQGKRLVLASTEQLHERVAQLEAALSQAYKTTSNAQHPLLAPEYLDGGFARMRTSNKQPTSNRPVLIQKTPPLNSGSSQMETEHNQSPNNPSSASSFTLATPLLDAERTTVQGRMTVESLLIEDTAVPEGRREDEWAGENAAPAMIIGTVGNPDTREDLDQRHLVFERLKKILKVLPPRDVMRKKAEYFWETSRWYQTILRREEFETIYEPAVYAPTTANPLSPHKLAVVLMVLTLQTYLDLDVSEDNPAVAEYWDAVQRCFDTRFGWVSSLAGVQALGLATLFVGFGWRGARASNFYWLRQMTSAALQLGLHRDAHPSFPDEEREFRRRLFYEVYVLDCLICLNHGQRAAMSVELIETAYPKNESQLTYKKYDFIRLVKSHVIDIGSLPDSAPASDEKINDIKQQLMQYDVTALPIVHCPILRGEPLPDPVEGFTGEDAKALQTTTTSMCHYKAMLYLFRPSLRRLIFRIRSNPTTSIIFTDQDRETVSSTYRACHAITLTSYYMARKHPRLMARAWMVWVQTFSAAVSMAGLAIWCGPFLEKGFVDSVYNELSGACDMISENGSKRSQGVLSLLPILKSLVSGRYPEVVGKNPSDAHNSPEGEDMLFALLGGTVDGIIAQQTPQQIAQNSSRPQIQHYSDLSLSRDNKPITDHASSQSVSQVTQQNSVFQSAPTGDGDPETYASTISFPPGNWTTSQTADTSCGAMLLPLVPPGPSAMPFDASDATLGNVDLGYMQLSNGEHLMSGDSSGDAGKASTVLDNPPQLWERLQMLYEPAAPLPWGAAGAGAGVGADYSGNIY
ncbi:uncharacterized protein L203_106003 [Cryptococcus depauperatus CBS 7841]|uniref:Zn(2)-C6 fungal-type domain-containing protein n=1 Tax=Cryptococcus depauperatus CBS 7841 TaxID=1295531 RepID=A0AAJ8M318_9TREE